MAALEQHSVWELSNFLTFWPMPSIPERCPSLNKCSRIYSSTSTLSTLSATGHFFCPKWTLLWKILWHNLHLLPFFNITFPSDLENSKLILYCILLTKTKPTDFSTNDFRKPAFKPIYNAENRNVTVFKKSLDLQRNCTSQFRISMPYCREISQREWQNNVVCDYHTCIT